MQAVCAAKAASNAGKARVEAPRVSVGRAGGTTLRPMPADSTLFKPPSSSPPLRANPVCDARSCAPGQTAMPVVPSPWRQGPDPDRGLADDKRWPASGCAVAPTEEGVMRTLCVLVLALTISFSTSPVAARSFSSAPGGGDGDALPVSTANHTVNNVQTTVTDVGAYGYVDPQGWQPRGLGFRFMGLPNALFHGGLVYGTAPNAVSDAAYGSDDNGATRPFNFRSIATMETGGTPQITQYTCSAFDDSDFDVTPLGLNTQQATYAWAGDSYVVIDLTITATNALSGLCIGLYTDWDIGNWADNRVGWDELRRLGTMWGPGGSDPNYYGIQLLSHPASGYRAVDVQAYMWPGFEDAEKFTFFSGFVTSDLAGDWANMISCGPFNLPAGGSVRVGFAMLAGASQAELQAQADQAQARWNAGIITPCPPVVADFSADPRHGPVPLSVHFHDLSSSNATSWRWDFDGDGEFEATEQNPIHLYDEPGVYDVTLVASNAGSADTLTKYDYITVTTEACPFVTDFENYQGGLGFGFPLVPQFGWYLPGTGSVDFNVYHYVGNALGIPNNPTGGGPFGKFIGGREPPSICRVQHDIVFPNTRWELAFDMCASELGGGFMGEGAPEAWYQRVGARADSLQFYFMVYDSAGAQVIPVFPGPAWRDLRAMNWYRSSMTVDFAANRITEVSLRDITGGGATITVNPVGWYLKGGAEGSTAPVTAFRFFADGTFAVDNLSIGDSVVAGFVGDPVSGRAPLDVQFTDTSLGSPTQWAWDFENDGRVDATTRNPDHTYTSPGLYSVSLTASNENSSDTRLRANYIEVLPPYADTVAVFPTAILSGDPAGVPVGFAGRDSLGAVSLFLDYDSSKLNFVGIESRVPDETFSGGIVGGRISVQWFDETGGFDPILPEEGDTLFTILVTPATALDTTRVTFDRNQSLIANRVGNALPDVFWRDQSPFGDVYINVGSVVSGRVGYYWLDRAVPRAVLSMGPPNPDVLSDAEGSYAFLPYPVGNYVLNIAKTDDTGGINSLDAIKVIRHSIGAEPLNNPYRLIAANVNGDAFINALDAIKIVRAAVGLEGLVTGDWKFVPDSLVFQPLNGNMPNQNFISIRMGDVNGDWTPSVGLAGVAGDVGRVPKLVISLSLPDTTVAPQPDSVRVPVRVREFNGIGAISLRIAVTDSVLQYRGLVSNVAGVSFTSNLVGNEIRIEWYDGTGGANPISIGNGTMLTLRFGIVGQAGEESPLDFTGQSMIGNAVGDPIQGVVFIDGRCRIAASGSVAEGQAVPSFQLFDASPNPFAGEASIAYELAREERVRLSVFNIRGELVRVLVDEWEGAGRHLAQWRVVDSAERRVPSGVYFIRLEAGRSVETRSVTVIR